MKGDERAQGCRWYAFYFRSVATITTVVQPRASAALFRSLNLVRERGSSLCVRTTKRKKNINARNEERKVKGRKREREREREGEGRGRAKRGKRRKRSRKRELKWS